MSTSDSPTLLHGNLLNQKAHYPCMISGKSLISNNNCYFSSEFSLEENILSDRWKTDKPAKNTQYVTFIIQ